jgi:hypothetical protein
VTYPLAFEKRNEPSGKKVTVGNPFAIPKPFLSIFAGIIS